MKMILIGCESRDGSNYKNYISSLGDLGVISGRNGEKYIRLFKNASKELMQSRHSVPK